MNYFKYFSFFFIISCFNEKKLFRTDFKYLALGDSYTIGESVNFTSSYPFQLKDEININKKEIIDSLQIIAKTGWTTNELIDTLSKIDLEKKYDMVSLLIGVNNQFREYDISTYRYEFENLLIRSIDYSTHKRNVFVLSIPDYGVTPFGKNRNQDKVYKEINLYNDINREISKKYNVMYFDITGISRLAEFDTSLVAFDNLHPSRKMYNLWVEKINQSDCKFKKSTKKSNEAFSD